MGQQFNTQSGVVASWQATRSSASPGTRARRDTLLLTMTRCRLKAAFAPVLCAILSLTLHAGAAAAQTPQAAHPAQPSLDGGKLKLIHARLQELVDNQTIPGAVALVARRGQVAYLDAVGSQDIENHKPMRTDSIFQIMSMTKPFTGVAIMMLVEEGKLESCGGRSPITFPRSPISRWRKCRTTIERCTSHPLPSPCGT